MADRSAVVHLGENSPEYVAWKLYEHVMQVENDRRPFNRKYLLDTYAECLDTVRGSRSYKKPD